MLSALHIENIAVISRADISFGSGFNLLTGETGAGKSILIDSIGAVLGARTSKDLIRTGCDRAVVTALFTDVSEPVKSKLAELDITPEEDGSLVIQRTLTADKSAAKINGVPVTAGMLKSVAENLVNIHGQHDNQSLFNTEKHYLYLDLLIQNKAIYDAYFSCYSSVKELIKEYKSCSMDESEKERRVEMLSYQIDELSAARIQPGEWETLKKQQQAIKNNVQISEAFHQAHHALDGAEDAPGAVSLCEDALNFLESIIQTSDTAAGLSERLRNLQYELSDLSAEVENQLSYDGMGPESLLDIEDRLDLFYKFSHKYGENEEAWLSFLSDAQKEYDGIKRSGERIKELESQIEDGKIKLAKAASALTDCRKKAAEEFTKSVSKELTFLDMPFVKFDVSFEKTACGKTGADKIEFLISTNPGELPKPLVKIASGGELSRIMLAIKSVLAECDEIDTLIFDEIDAGISGHAAHKVGLRLRDTAKKGKKRQVICITHLAQIAALADVHLFIEKRAEAGKTFTSIVPLDFEGRKRELARIMGTQITDLTLHTAEEMLEEAGIKKEE